jgi:hypothetical protein
MDGYRVAAALLVVASAGAPGKTHTADAFKTPPADLADRNLSWKSGFSGVDPSAT